MKFISLILLPALLMFSCNTKVSDSDAGVPHGNERLLTSVSWYQHSGEMRALYYQCYNIAREKLDLALQSAPKGKPLAVVTDIDETLLDNSPFEASLVTGNDNLEGWYNWTAKATAKALPGALEFFSYAKSRGVAVFYITNRDDNERTGTLKNLLSEGFPFVDEAHLLTKSDTAYSTGNTSSKVGRREKVSSEYNILMLLGDNLNDFSGIFEDRKLNGGKEQVDANRELFGRKYFVLPNPMYGAWEKPQYGYNDTLDDRGRTREMLSRLRME